MTFINISNYFSEFYNNYTTYYNNLQNNQQYNFYIAKNGKINKLTDLLDKIFKNPEDVILKSKFNLFYKHLNNELHILDKLNPRMKNIYSQLISKRDEITQLNDYYNTHTVFEMLMMDIIHNFIKIEGKAKFFRNIDTYYIEYSDQPSLQMNDINKYPTMFDQITTTRRASKYKLIEDIGIAKLYKKIQ